MDFPPPGYDDQTVVPVQRLKWLLGQLEDELNKIQSVFYQHLPGQFRMPAKNRENFGPSVALRRNSVLIIAF